MTPRKAPLHHMCYRAKFGRCRSNIAGVSRGSQRFWESCPL